jgi:BirA family biotin operon repressor/biotin-[acetyl-CoA-carboxylase] ligase
MNNHDLGQTLSDLPLGELRYFDTLGSTNDEALAWATQGAPDLSLVVADEQTAGRGRLGRKWFTPPGAALAFSLVLRPSQADRPHLSRTVGLAALAVCHTLSKYSMGAKIKWPNDVLILGRKVAGILVETVWTGDEVDCQVIGIGVNLRKEAVPYHLVMQFPGTSLEGAGISVPERGQVLHGILSELISLRPRMVSDEFIKEWQDLLAFRGEQVILQPQEGASISGQLLGLEADGSLRLRDETGVPITIQFGDVSLRPAA